MTTLRQLNKRLSAVTDPLRLFGPDPDATFRQLSKICHPDKFTEPSEKKMAEETFSLLTQLRQKLNGRMMGNITPVVGKWAVIAPLTAGDVCDVYQVQGSGHSDGILKLARDESDNDLMDREVQALKKLHRGVPDPKYLKYIPTTLDQFTVDNRRVNVIGEVKEGYTLPELASVCDLSEFRHIVWMFNRLLTALWVAHSSGIIHGAVIPQHLLYLPQDHGLVLVDWTAATEMKNGNKIPYMSMGRENLYPPEVRSGAFGAGTDIYMAARCMQQVIRPASMPKEFKPIFDYCLASSIKSRPSDVLELQHQWKETAKRVYGPPKFMGMKVQATV